MDILEARAKLAALDIPTECEIAFNANARYSEDLNRQQLSVGVKSDGTHLTPYRPMTIMIKSRKGQQLDPKNLRDTEAFWKSIHHYADNGVVYFIAWDKKTPKLEADNGEAILGLVDQSIAEMEPRWQNSLYDLVATKLQLK